MPAASQHTSAEFTKLLFIGNSGAGKTGALTSLVAAGYKIRIIDLDSGLEALINHVREECPDNLDNIEYQTFRDRIKMTAQGPRVKGSPTAYTSTLEALERWPDDGSDPATWGKDYILVVDSLTNVGRAAFQWARAINPTSKDPRQWYKVAQDLIEDLIANLTSDDFRTNVIVISHVDMGENASGQLKGFVSSIGKALGPKLPRFFNTLILSETKGTGKNVKRELKTAPTALLDLKNPASMRMSDSYDISDGMIKIFKVLQSS
jgi:hypothetical protein